MGKFMSSCPQTPTLDTYTQVHYWPCSPILSGAIGYRVAGAFKNS